MIEYFIRQCILCIIYYITGRMIMFDLIIDKIILISIIKMSNLTDFYNTYILLKDLIKMIVNNNR